MSTINTEQCVKPACKRQAFELKPPTAACTSDVVLRIHHTVITGHGNTQAIRFLHASFNATGELFAASNHLGNVYVFDLTLAKYWLLAHVNCSLVAFVQSPETHAKELLLVGATVGEVHVFNALTGRLVSDLHGHRSPVTDVSFADGAHARAVTLGGGGKEAIVWHLENFTKLQVLQLADDAVLKFVQFVPVSGDIIACFQDDTVQVWRGRALQPLRQLVPESVGGSFQKLMIRSIAFTGNGKLMAIVGHSPVIYIFCVETLKLKKEYTFTDVHVSVKKALFLPNPFDDGVNKVLTLLATSGILYFYNMETEMVATKITIDGEVWKYSLDPTAHKVATIGKQGDVLVHSLESLFTRLKKRKVIRDASKVAHKSTKKNKVVKKDEATTIISQLSMVLETDKLKAILREFGEYPSLYRKIIWSHLLQLPNDEKQFAIVTRNIYENNFEDFAKNYPLEVKQDLKNLKRTLGNLVSWCPFLSVVPYLPVLVFPFVKFLQSEPVTCFETIMTIIVNYCQYWFEYHPVPPLNILGLVESILLQQDHDLVKHFKNVGVTSKTYAWFLLQSVFSEVLAASDWLVFCDHLVSNEPSFLIVATAAYSLVNRVPLMHMHDVEDFEFFYRTNSAFDFKRLIARSYKLLDDDIMRNHPRSFLAPFQPFENGKYPHFDRFPKNCLQVCRSIDRLRKESQRLKADAGGVKRVERERVEAMQRASEELLRQNELRHIYVEKLQEERRLVETQRQRLRVLRKSINVKDDDDVLKSVTQQFLDTDSKDSPKRKNLRIISKTTKSVESLEDNLLQHYTNLLKHKIQIEGLADESTTAGGSLDIVQLKKNYQELSAEINKTQTRKTVPSKEYLKQLNIATGLAAVDSLIQKVETRISGRGTTMDKSQTRQIVCQLATETEELSEEITKLMVLLAETK